MSGPAVHEAADATSARRSRPPHDPVVPASTRTSGNGRRDAMAARAAESAAQGAAIAMSHRDSEATWRSRTEHAEACEPGLRDGHGHHGSRAASIGRAHGNRHTA